MLFIVEPRNSVAHRCLPVHGIHVQDWSYNGLSCTCMCNYIDVYNLALSNYSYQSYMYMYGFMIKVNTVVYLFISHQGIPNKYTDTCLCSMYVHRPIHRHMMLSGRWGFPLITKAWSLSVLNGH